MGTRARRALIPRERMVKPIDAWWTVMLVDPIATRVVPLIAHVGWLTPTRITLVAHILGVASTVLFASHHLVLGALVFEVRFVLDCIDGKLARVTDTSSLFGKLLDTWGDRVLFLTNAAALGWHESPLVVAILMAAYPLQFHVLEARLELLGRAESDQPMDRVLQGSWGAALARRRLFPVPTSVDVEHLLLFGGPVIGLFGWDVIELLLWLVTTFFVVSCARYAASMLRAAVALDRATTASDEGPTTPTIEIDAAP